MALWAGKYDLGSIFDSQVRFAPSQKLTERSFSFLHDRHENREAFCQPQAQILLVLQKVIVVGIERSDHSFVAISTTFESTVPTLKNFELKTRFLNENATIVREIAK